jgi:hypothetical protein
VPPAGGDVQYQTQYVGVTLVHGNTVHHDAAIVYWLRM